MEPSVDPPAAVEPVVHIAHVATANPSPSPSYASIPNHPPYAEMITAAISSLKERNGSSRMAIAKYIEREYSNLPQNHSALLTYHLKRLKNCGFLVMIKRSYMLPISSPTQAPSSNHHVEADGVPFLGLPQRQPGRPPKLKPSRNPNHNPFAQPNMEVGSDLGAAVGSDAVLVSLGLVNEPVKKGPGRPPKQRHVGETDGGAAAGKRGRGRPPSAKLASVLMGQGRPKRGRGRPPKSGRADQVAGGLPRKGKRPGRPKKNVETAAAAGSVSVPIGGGSNDVGGDAGVLLPNGGGSNGGAAAGGEVLPLKRRGRPPKVGAAKKPLGGDSVADGASIGAIPTNGVGGGNSYSGGVADGAGAGVLLVGARGGPSKVDGVKKPRKLTGKPLGRPKKIASVKEIVAVDPQPLMAYQDLKSKLECFQFKVKQAVSAVKPYLNHETAASAIVALQELEDLATVDVIPPLNVQGQEPLFLDQEKSLHG